MEWKESDIYSIGKKKIDIEKGLENNIENMGNKEDRKGISSKEDLKVIASKTDLVKMAKEMDSKEYLQELIELINDIKHRFIPYFSTHE